MAAVNEYAGERRHRRAVAQQQAEQPGQTRPARAAPHAAPQTPAEPARDRVSTTQRESSGENDPADIDEGRHRRAVARERAPLARQRPRRVGQHADIGGRPRFRAGPGSAAASRPNSSRCPLPAGWCRRRCRARRRADRQRRTAANEQQREQHCRRGARPEGRAGKSGQPQPHAVGLRRNRRRLCLLIPPPQAGRGSGYHPTPGYVIPPRAAGSVFGAIRNRR